MIYVVDASVAAEYLLRTELGARAAGFVKGASLVAPSLLDVEVLSIARRAVLRGFLPQPRAVELLEDLAAWPIRRVAPETLLWDAWRFRQNVSAYDAFYVATAIAFEAPLLTADGPLARAPGLGIMVHNVRIS